MERNIKIHIVSCERTDLMCICCGNFRTDFAVLPGANVGILADPVVGVHKKCIPLMHVKRADTVHSDVQDD